MNFDPNAAAPPETIRPTGSRIPLAELDGGYWAEGMQFDPDASGFDRGADPNLPPEEPPRVIIR